MPMSEHVQYLAEHTIRIRDLRARFGDPETYAAECSCGWKGAPHGGPSAGRNARQEGLRHYDAQRLAAKPAR